MAAFAGALKGAEIVNVSGSAKAALQGAFVSISGQPIGSSPYFWNEGEYMGGKESWETFGFPAMGNINPFTGHAVTGLRFFAYFK